MNKFKALSLVFLLFGATVFLGCGDKENDDKENDEIIASFEGSGTQIDPYLIGTAAELAELADLMYMCDTYAEYTEKYYKLTADIDLSDYKSGKGWKPIGTYEGYDFRGHFDGNYHTVRGLYINADEYKFVGLFGWISGGTVINLGVEGDVYGDENVGGLAGNFGFKSLILNCYAAVNVGGGWSTGGLAGSISNGSSVINCYATGSVSALGSVGGLAGAISYDCSVTNCYAANSVHCIYGNMTGGIAGYFSGIDTRSKIENCVALNPSVSEGGAFVGRVIGLSTNGTLTNNLAWEGMLVNGVTVADGSATNGTDITALQAKTQTAYVNLGWKFGNNDDNPWKMGVSGYGLPVFWWQATAPTVMPEHLK